MVLLAPGSTVQDRYRVDHLIGQGGFGAVYEAVDERLGRRVALKQLLRISDRISRQFEREARLLANLDHPALPSVIDHFSTPNGQFLVMQYVRGTDLADQLAQRGAPFPLAQVLLWGDQVLDVLHYLHSLQPPIVHRDIKPQNMKLKADGTIMLLDFGLAKGFAGESPPSTTESSLLAYTKGYAPPEQIEGTGTDARSDLYALGATLHCLLTNVLPVEAAMRLLAEARGRPDPLRPAHEVSPAVPEDLSGVLEQALALEPDRRPASADQMRALLQATWSQNLRQLVHPAPVPHGSVRAVTADEHTGQQTARPAPSPSNMVSAPPTAAPTALPGRPDERAASLPPAPAAGGQTEYPGEPATNKRTQQPAAIAAPAQTGLPAEQIYTQQGIDTLEHAAAVPPTPPAPPPRARAAGKRLPRPACLAVMLGGALLALCLGGTAVAGAMGWFGGFNTVVANPSPAPSIAAIVGPSEPAIAAQIEQPPATAVPTATPAPAAASPSPAPSSRPDALVSSTRLNLRAGPGEVYGIKASYSEGTPLRVLGKHVGSRWLYVQTPDGNDGWMFSDFLLVNVPLANVAAVAAPPTPLPAPTTASTRTPPASAPPKASAAPSAGGEDSVRIIAIWPEPGTPLKAGQPYEFQIKLQYSLQSADEAMVVLFMEQFPGSAGGCSGANHKTNGGAQFPIQRGQGIATVQVTWNGAGGDGFVGPGVNFWSNVDGKAAQPLIRGFGVLGEPCYPFAAQ